MERIFITIDTLSHSREPRGRAVVRPFDGPPMAEARGRSLSAAWET